MNPVKNVNKAKKKKKLFGCPPLPTPNFWKLEKSFYCTKVYRPLFSEFQKKVFFFLWEFWSFKNIFVYILILVLNLYKDIFW